MRNGGLIQTKKKEYNSVFFSVETRKMSVTPPEAPPYPTTPEEIHQDDEASVAAYAQILVRFCF